MSLPQPCNVPHPVGCTWAITACREQTPFTHAAWPETFSAIRKVSLGDRVTAENLDRQP
jgi:hypothetical protein